MPESESVMPQESPANARKSHYDEYATSREPSGMGKKVHAFWHRRMFAMAETVIPSLAGMSVLEIGVGFGFFARHAIGRGCRYSGIELNEKLAERLRSEGVDVVCTAVPPIPPGEMVDVIWMSHVLEHAPTYLDARAMLAEAYERIVPGGYIVLIAPDYLSWRGEFWGCDWSHGFPTTLNRCTEILQDVGYSVVTAKHHTATVFQPVVAFAAAEVFGLLPYRLLDLLLEKLAGRRLAYAFMGLFGWRQVFIVARKPTVDLD
jgi:SAM-dependent methyltransferase